MDTPMGLTTIPRASAGSAGYQAHSSEPPLPIHPHGPAQDPPWQTRDPMAKAQDECGEEGALVRVGAPKG